MKCEVLVDLGFGSTGKGAVASYLAKKNKYDASIRVQSIQAGHTLYNNGNKYIMRTIPCAWVNPNIALVLGPGIFLEKELLLHEIEMISKAMGEDVRDRLYVDFRATYIIPEDVEAEKNLDKDIGSTAHGCGSSLIRKIWRRGPFTAVRDDTWAKDNGIKVVDTIRLMQNMNILAEGCQGTMLSLNTSPYYPFVTSRESTASGIIADMGISPRTVTEIHGVFRTLPIRVGGHSGDTGGKELDWDSVSNRAGRPVTEITTVTKRVRRIFEFSDEDFEHAVLVNRPTKYYMTFADYLGPDVYGAKNWNEIGPIGQKAIIDFMDHLEAKHNVRVNWLSTGEKEFDYIEL